MSRNHRSNLPDNWGLPTTGVTSLVSEDVTPLEWPPSGEKLGLSQVTSLVCVSLKYSGALSLLRNISFPYKYVSPYIWMLENSYFLPLNVIKFTTVLLGLYCEEICMAMFCPIPFLCLCPSDYCIFYFVFFIVVWILLERILTVGQ